jgi:hypothetical protein
MEYWIPVQRLGLVATFAAKYEQVTVERVELKPIGFCGQPQHFAARLPELRARVSARFPRLSFAHSMKLMSPIQFFL